MNDKLTISTAQLLALFPDELAARHYIESRRWPNGTRCPVCASDRIGAHSPGIYRCNACEEAFTVRTGTVMERSHVPLSIWLRAAWMLANEGVSSMRLARIVRIRQATTWSLLERLRKIRLPAADLDTITDHILAHRPQPKSKPAKKRERRRRKIQRQSSG